MLIYIYNPTLSNTYTGFIDHSAAIITNACSHIDACNAVDKMYL
jgi:hypothetical protein